MQENRTELRLALSRLMAALAPVSASNLVPSERDELIAAREEAAKALLMNRVLSGRPWIAESGPGTFYDAWAALRLGVQPQAAVQEERG